ncbi:MAG: S8 family serine peptidase [Tepidisphaera sp.]|nr:S8 family serine peptidase [Tepidisphaera sp.]
MLVARRVMRRGFGPTSCENGCLWCVSRGTFDGLKKSWRNWEQHMHARAAAAGLIIGSSVLCAGLRAQPCEPASQTKASDALTRTLATRGASVRAWVIFQDKGLTPADEALAIADLEHTYPARAVERRRLRRTDPGLFDARDLPVSARYQDQVRGLGLTIIQESRWANAVSVQVTSADVQALSALPCVRAISPVRFGTGVPQVDAHDAAPAYGARDFYGQSSNQLTQIDLPALHARGYTGQGVIIGILDTGFRRDHAAFNQAGHVVNVLAEYDFINHDGNAGIDPGDPADQHTHGTLILGCIGAYLPGTLVGGAYDASFVLCKTEDVTSEMPIEEDNYVAGLEFIEMHGGDMTTSSLGYSDWYTQADFDGVTAVTTIGVNTATANGVFCCTAAGNDGHDSDPATSHLIAPADAFNVITCGAANGSGSIAGFSSDGPTADGRLKPEILARGVNTWTVSPNDASSLSQASGTSLSTPLVAAAVACLVQAHPNWTVAQMREAIFHTASDFIANGQPDPLFVRGYGVLDANAAAGPACDPDVNQDGVADQGDVDYLINVVAGGGNPAGIDPDFNHDGVADQGDVDALVNAVAGGGCP